MSFKANTNMLVYIFVWSMRCIDRCIDRCPDRLTSRAGLWQTLCFSILVCGRVYTVFYKIYKVCHIVLPNARQFVLRTTLSLGKATFTALQL